MKDLKQQLMSESKINFGKTQLEINIIVASTKDSKSFHKYNLNGINNAVKDAYTYDWDLFYEVSNGSKKVITQSLKEAIEELK